MASIGAPISSTVEGQRMQNEIWTMIPRTLLSNLCVKPVLAGHPRRILAKLVSALYRPRESVLKRVILIFPSIKSISSKLDHLIATLE